MMPGDGRVTNGGPELIAPVLTRPVQQFRSVELSAVGSATPRHCFGATYALPSAAGAAAVVQKVVDGPLDPEVDVQPVVEGDELATVPAQLVVANDWLVGTPSTQAHALRRRKKPRNFRRGSSLCSLSSAR